MNSILPQPSEVPQQDTPCLAILLQYNQQIFLKHSHVEACVLGSSLTIRRDHKNTLDASPTSNVRVTDCCHISWGQRGGFPFLCAFHGTGEDLLFSCSVILPDTQVSNSIHPLGPRSSDAHSEGAVPAN